MCQKVITVNVCEYRIPGIQIFQHEKKRENLTQQNGINGLQK